MTQTLQGALQQAIRNATGKTTQDFNGDLHDLCGLYGIPQAPISGRIIPLAQIFDSTISSSSAALNYLLQNSQTVVGPIALFSNGEQGAWYDPSDYSTLFQDSAGTTPVTAVEQFVGLMLDKSKGLVPFWSGYFDGTGDFLTAPSNSAFALGTGAFTIECWAYLSAVNDRTIFGYASSNSGGIAVFADSAPQRRVYLNNLAVMTVSGNFPANTWVHIAVTGDGANNIFLWQNGVQIGTVNTAYNITSTNFQIGRSLFNDFSGYISNLRVVKGAAIYTGNFTPPAVPLAAISGTSLLTCQSSTFIDNSPNNFTITVNGNTVTSQRIPFGNHATQTTSAKRPKLAARYNLLTYSEQFDNGVWTKSNAAVTANSVAAPDGTTTADKLIENNGVNRGVIYQLAPQTGQVFSVFAKAAEWNRVAIGFTNGAGLWGMQVFNLSTGALDGTASYGGTTFTNPTITPVGSGWYRCAVTANSVTSTLCAIMPFNQSGDPVNPSPALVGDGTSGIYIWGADLRPASQATGLIGPTYQRVVDAATYDTAGFLPYLEFNGLSWSMSTGSIDFTATDKMTVWAGYRISAGTGSQMLAELTANGYTTNGGFAVGQGPNAGTSGFGFLMNNGAGIAGETAAITVPYSSVISYQFDSALSGLANEAKLRRNQVAQTYASTTGTDSGTGNFANAPLYLGARLGTSVYINGWLTSLIVRGAQSTQGQIEATEAWVNGRTGAF